MNKTCYRCNTEKDISDFYKHSQMADGYLNKCKKCCKKESTKNRVENIDYYTEYDRKRFQEDPRVRERHERYRKSEKGILSINKSRQKWLDDELNAIRRKSHNILNSHIRNNKLIKPNVCQLCDEESSRIEGHHYDYSKPLDVFWLCRLCHVSVHRDLSNLNLDLMNEEHREMVDKYIEERHNK